MFLFNTLAVGDKITDGTETYKIIRKFSNEVTIISELTNLAEVIARDEINRDFEKIAT